MEQEDRKKKVAAGKEKLAAFRKKRAKKKKAEGDDIDSQTQSFDSTQNSTTELEVSNLANVSLSDLHSFMGEESDHCSLTSGDEWSAEESELQASLHYQTKLAAATQRIAELEETVEGKQLALDRMVLEMQGTDPSHKITEGVVVGGDTHSCFTGSVSELQDALVERDKIIRQLTTHLQKAAVSRAHGLEDHPGDYAQETLRLSQQVGLLQQQLTQAGERVEQQAAMCQMSVGALQEAKAQILSLQGRVGEKNSLLQHLSHSLSARTSEVSALQRSEVELKQLVSSLQQQAADSGSDCLMAAQSAASRVVSLEQELEKLGSEHAESTQSVLELQHKLEASEGSLQAHVSEKQLALEKIVGLEEELGQLALVRDEAMRKMSVLEQQVQEDSVLIQAQADSQAIEAVERAALLEQQMEQLKENHRVQVGQLEHSLTESSESSETDMQSLRNIFNTQQGELLTLREQVKEKEEELVASRQQLQSMHDQLDQFQSKYEQQQSEATGTVHSFQQQVQELREENSRYQQQTALVQEQICSFRECLHFSPLSPVSSGETSISVEGCGAISSDSDLTGQIKQLQTCYTHLLGQYSEVVEKNNLTRSEVQTSLQLQASPPVEGLGTERKDGTADKAAETTQLQSEVEELKAAVRRKDAEMGQLSSKLQSVSEEKNRLALRAEEQEQVTEQHTLQSDTLQRRMESRVNSLFTEVTEYKEALKESELANIELQDKLDLKSKQIDSLKLQLAASEDLMKDLQNRVNAQGDEQEQIESELQRRVNEMTHSLSQLREELQGKETALSQLQEQLKEKDLAHSHIQQQLSEKDSSFSELQDELKKKDSSVSQLQEQLQEKDSSVLQLQKQVQEKDSVVSQLQEQVQEKDSVVSQLQEKDSAVSNLQEQLQDKDSSLSQLQEELQRQAEDKTSAVRQLQDQLSEKEKTLMLVQEQMEDKHATLSHAQNDLEEKEKTVVQLKEQLEVGNQLIQTLRNDFEASAVEVRQKNVQLSEGIERLHQQLAEAHEQREAMLVEREQLVSQHQEQIRRTEENLEQNSAEVKRTLESKERLEVLLSSADDTKTRQLSEMSNSLEEMSKELEDIKAEKEKLLTELSSLKAERDAEIEQNQSKVDEFTERLKQAIEEKEQLACSFELIQDESSQQLKDLQEKLEQSKEQYQTLLSEKQELSSLQMAATDRQTELENQLQLKEQESEILFAENEGLHEEFQSISSAYVIVNKRLKVELSQQSKKLDILTSELDNFQDKLFSKDSECSHQLHKAHEKLKENAKETDLLKAELRNMEDAGILKENGITSLQTEVDSLKEKLMQAENAHAEVSHDRDQAGEALHSRVHDLEQEVQNSKEENEGMTSRLAAQADMFKVKQEEMAAENNDLNHQLEEVRNEAQETVHRLQEQLEDLHKQLKETSSKLEFQEEEVAKLKEELQTSRTSLQIQEGELDSLREEDSRHRDSLDSLKVSNDALGQEKEGLLIKIQNLESSIEEIQKRSDEGVEALQSEIQQLREEKHIQLTEFEKERSLVAEQHTSLQEQLHSCNSEIERLQHSLKDTVTEQDKLKTDNSRLQQLTDSLQLDFSSQIEQAQSELAAKDTELQSVQTQLRDSTAQLTRQLDSLQEEIAAAQSEIEQKESSFISATEELTATKQQLERSMEEKEMLKSNFDSCMEDMTQRTTEKETVIQQLQGRLVEASQNVDRDHVQLREIYESQLSELEDRLATADLETQRLEKLCESVGSEKDKLKDKYNSHVADLELTVQVAESESSRLKEQMSKMSRAQEKEIADLKHSNEIQLSSMEDNCQSMEKTLAKQGALLAGANNKYERERGDREKSFDQQLSEAYEQARMYEMDISRLKRQLDEMRKDHQKELQETQKPLEDQVFDLENKCVVTASELERLRQSLWGMEQDHSSDTQTMRHRIQELEALSHSQEKQISDSQEKLSQSSQLSNDSMVSLRESLQFDVTHLDEVNQRLKEDAEGLQSQLKAMQTTHRLEMEALKHEHSQRSVEIQEKCRQAESYSNVLRSHMESASPPTRDPERDILQEEIQRLQEELVGAESSITVLKQRLKAAQASHQTKALAENSSLPQAAPAHDAASVSRRLVPAGAAEVEQQIKQVQMRRMGPTDDDGTEKEKKGGGFVTEGGFEPEPGSLEYLDLAIGPKDEGDYFVEESEPNQSPKPRNKSVPSEAYLEALNEQNLSALQPKRSSSNKHSDQRYQVKGFAGRFEPDVDEGRFEYSNELRSESMVEGFQPESVPVSPSTQIPVTAPNPSFLPHPNAALAGTHTQIPSVDVVNSSSQTDLPILDSLAVTAARPSQTPEQLQTVEDSSQAAQESSLSDDDKSVVDAEVARKLKGLQDELEEEWVLKMRSQEVELRHVYDEKFEEFRRQVEHQCQKRIRVVKQDTQASFVDAVRKMRKSLEKKQKQEERETDAITARMSGAGKGISNQDAPDGSDDEKLGNIVKQLHEENQELAEVRDVLLQQIAISQTQGLRHTMQHELQAVVAGGNRLSPQSTPTSSPAPQPPAPESPETAPVLHQQLEAAQNASNMGRLGGAQSPTHDGDSAGQSAPLAGSDDDDDDDDDSDSSCVRERFLEELEEMSQQSGQDLPLEWELTSAAVSVSQAGSSGSVAGIFERDLTGGESVWEVFDGRCLRHDCREVRHRYNNLFHWLSKICRIPSTTPTLLAQGGSQGEGGSDQGGMVQGEGQVEGWVPSNTEKFDSNFLNQILEGKAVPEEALLPNKFSSEPGLEDKDNFTLTETSLLSRLLSAEDDKIHLEQRMNSRQQLFNQERGELEQRGVHLQARCGDLESGNRELSQQLAELQVSCKHTEGQREPENKTGDLPDESCPENAVQTRESYSQTETEPRSQEMPGSSQKKTAGIWQEEKRELTQQLSTVQTALVVQQEENVKQEREKELEEQCALLSAQVKKAMTENDTLRSDILIQQETEKELKGKCSSLVEKLEVMSDYPEIAQDRDDVQHVCSSLKEQLAASQKNMSNLHQENRSLSEENESVTRNCRKLKQTVEHLQDIENSYKALEARLCDVLQEKEKHSVQHAQSSVQVGISETNQPGASVSRASNVASEKDVKELRDEVGSLKGEITFLREKINIFEENNKLLQNQCHNVQVRNRLLEYQADAHNSRCEILSEDLQSVKEDLKEADHLNKSLHDNVYDLEKSKEKCEAFEKSNKSLSDEIEHLKEEDSSLKADCKTLNEKCQALQEELQEAKMSGQSLREQLHEQSMTLEQVISEMKEESFEGNRNQEADRSEGEHGVDEGDYLGSAERPLQSGYRTEAELKHKVSRLERVLTDKDSLIAELKEQMTALSLQQAAMGCPPALPESTKDLEREVHDLREELVEKESIIQDLQEQQQTLKQSQGQLKRKLNEDSDLEQEVSILHQALFEKEKLIQELKETSKLLHLSQQEKSHHVRRHNTSSYLQEPNTERQERMLSTEAKETLSSRSVESTDSIAISSDPDSDISPGQEVDIVKEMGRLRKVIKKTKAVYANESALFQEALDREPVSHLGPRASRSSSLSVDFSEMNWNDIPDDSEQLKKIVVKLLEENKSLTTENLRLQLRIREQEALVLEMEGRLQKIRHPPDDLQPLFERQLLLLQKQRDELQHLICERDTGVGLLSVKIGKESVEAAAIQKQQEDLTMKIGELEHCHQLLQQRQAELAHCQAEKRHLEQILLLKDETERQLMRQKRLLEEELSTIEAKLQEREATLVEEKTRLMRELREKEQHIFHLQSSQSVKSQQPSSQRQAVLMAGPQGASTPFLTKKFEASQAFFLQPLSPEEQDPSILHQAEEEEAQGGSFLEEHVEDPKSTSFEESRHRAVLSQPTESHLLSRRHSTGALGSGRPSSAGHHMPRDPSEMDRFHREAVDRLREKLRLQVEEEMAQQSEGQASAITGYWQRRSNQES